MNKLDNLETLSILLQGQKMKMLLSDLNEKNTGVQFSLEELNHIWYPYGRK